VLPLPGNKNPFLDCETLSSYCFKWNVLRHGHTWCSCLFHFLPSHSVVSSLLIPMLGICLNTWWWVVMDGWWMGGGFPLLSGERGTGVCTQGLPLARQCSTTLSHVPSPFYLSYFFDRVSLFCLEPASGPHSYLGLLCSWDDRCAPPCPACCWANLELGPTDIYLPRDTCISSRYRYEPLCPAPCSPSQRGFHDDVIS
jgi:hypothetical protein